MPFNAGAVIGTSNLDDSGWKRGAKGIATTSKNLTSLLTTGLAAGFAAVAAGITASVVQANSYQKEFANVSTLTQQNTDALQDMSLGLLSLDSELGTTRELTKSMYDAISAGAEPGADALETVAASAQFAKAALADNAASVKLLSATVNAYGRENITSEKAADIFFTTVKQGVVTGEELAATIGQSIPLFSSMNIPVEQLASGMAAMTKQGVSASEATTQLNAIVSAFLKPSEALTAVLEEQGHASGQAFIESEGLTGALELLKNATGEGGAEIAELLPNIRAMRGAMALSGQGAIEFENTLKAMEESTGAVSEAFGKQEKTFATFKAELGKTSIIVGNIAKFFVDDLAAGAQTALEAINQFLTAGDGLNAFAGIAEKVAGGFMVMKTFGEELFNLISGTFGEVVFELKETFNELFAGTMDSGDAFNFLADAVDLLGAGLNVSLQMTKLFITSLFNMAKIAQEAAGVIGSLWEVMTGKKSFAEVKDNINAVKDAFVNFGTDFAENTADIIAEAQEQWAGLTDDAETNAAVFASSWEKGSSAASKFVRENYKAMISGVKEGDEQIQDSSTKTAEVIAENNEDNAKSTVASVDTQTTAWETGLNDMKVAAIEATEIMKMTFTDWADYVLGLFNDLTSGIDSITSGAYQNELDKLELSRQKQLTELEDSHKKELKGLKAKFDAGEISEENYEKSLTEIKENYSNEKIDIEDDTKNRSNKIAEKQFKTQKRLSIAKIWIDYAAAVMGFWKAMAGYGPPGWIAAGIATVAHTGVAVAQTAVVNKQQFVPAYKDGTSFHQGGPALVGEEGEEIVNMPRGASVIPNSITSGILDSIEGTQSPVNVNFPGMVVREEADVNKIAAVVDQTLSRRIA